MKYTLKQIIDRYNSGEKIDYVMFWENLEDPGKVTKPCLSNWYECSFYVGGTKFFTTEQYMMAQKALLFGDKTIYDEIMKAHDPKTFKSLGKEVRHFNPTFWDENKCRIVFEGNLAKFSQNPKLKEFILSTKDAVLVEASPLDKIWGIGLNRENKDSQNPNLWKGENNLGFTLMEVRDAIKS